MGAFGPYLVDILIVAAIIFFVVVIAAFATGTVLTRTITRSVADLYEATLHVRRGDFSHRVRVTKRDQLGALGESFNDMTSSISELIEGAARAAALGKRGRNRPRSPAAALPSHSAHRARTRSRRDLPARSSCER